MVVTDGTSEVTRVPRLRFTPWKPTALPSLERTLPLVVTAAVLTGLVLALAITPLGSGDYGQWLMTSRPFLGEAVPAYRDLTDVPPVVPFVLSSIRTVVRDPVVALHVVNAILLLGLGAALFLLGTAVLESRWGGALAVVIGLLVTDRLIDLFAFGGMLQAGALLFGCLAVAGVVRAAPDPLTATGAWWLAAISLALAGMTHVGTGLIAIPIGLALSGIVGLAALARAGWDHQPLVDRLLWPGLALAAVGLYWLVILVPASGDYVTNPASLAYRGPDRLWADLFDRWPTAVVLVVGAAALGLAAIRSLLLRRLDGLLLVAVWAAMAWAVLAWSLVSGSATDFPRFATPLLAPLVIGAAAAVLWGLRTFAISLGDVGWRGPSWAVTGAAVVLAVVVAAPLTIERHVRQAEFYELRDAEALRAASAWIDAELPAGASVLADVREAKWIEGLTGRPALFSQSVRYAFRPAEWQRSTDADALLRSTLALTSGYIAAVFTDEAPVLVGGEGASTPSGRTVPTGLVIRANHGGEFLDLLRVEPSVPQIDSATTGDLYPIRSSEMVSDRQASLRTVWGLRDVPSFAFTQTATTFLEGTTLRLVQTAPGHRFAIELTPSFGMEFTYLDVHAEDATVCFTEIGGSEPCLLVRTTDGEGRLSTSAAGNLIVRSGGSGEIELLVTAMSAGDASVRLGLLDPAELVDAHAVGAVLLHEPDPAYRSRVRRLQSLGFEVARAFGPYRVLMRDGSAGS